MVLRSAPWKKSFSRLKSLYTNGIARIVSGYREVAVYFYDSIRGHWKARRMALKYVKHTRLEGLTTVPTNRGNLLIYKSALAPDLTWTLTPTILIVRKNTETRFIHLSTLVRTAVGAESRSNATFLSISFVYTPRDKSASSQYRSPTLQAKQPSGRYSSQFLSSRYMDYKRVKVENKGVYLKNNL